MVAGGDGTLNDVLNGLPDPIPDPHRAPAHRDCQRPRPRARIPEKDGFIQIIEGGHVRRLDMGLLGERRFLMMAHAPLDAMVTEEVQRQRRGRDGYLGYLMPILRALRRYHPPDLEVAVDGGKQITGAFVIVSNTRNYGGIFSFADRARCDSGHLDVSVFPRGALPALVWYYFSAFHGWASRRTNVRYLTGNRIRIQSREPVVVQVDGDPSGVTPQNPAFAGPCASAGAGRPVCMRSRLRTDHLDLRRYAERGGTTQAEKSPSIFAKVVKACLAS